MLLHHPLVSFSTKKRAWSSRFPVEGRGLALGAALGAGGARRRPARGAAAPDPGAGGPRQARPTRRGDTEAKPDDGRTGDG